MNNARGFTLVEVLVALIVVAMGLAALMVAVSGTARTSGFLRDKTLADPRSAEKAWRSPTEGK